ncbi:MAG: lipopolysaccharide biosynthesis protein [Aestuariivirga sp.]
MHLIAWLKAKNQIFGLADQLVVSMTSFVTMIVIARATDVAQLGLYSIAVSVLVMALTVQDSLVTRPYSIQILSPSGTPEEHGFSALLLSWGLAIAALLVALSVAFAVSLSGRDPAEAILALAIACALPLALFREFGRRYSYANLKTYRAFMVDAVAAGATLMPMAYLGWMGRLDAAKAILIIGFGAGLSGTLWFLRRRSAFRYSRPALNQTARRSFGLGKWLLFGQIAMQLQGYAIHWITLAAAGAAVTGTYAACLSIIGLANPFVFGFLNLLTPKSVRTLKHRGPRELRREVLRDSLMLGGMMALFTIFIYFAGETVMVLIYGGGAYANQGEVLTVLSLASVAGAIGSFGAPAAIALQSAERGKATAAIATFTCIAGIAISWMLIARAGLIGAAWGLLVTEVIGAIGRWALFVRIGFEKPHVPKGSPD